MKNPSPNSKKVKMEANLEGPTSSPVSAGKPRSPSHSSTSMQFDSTPGDTFSTESGSLDDTDQVEETLKNVSLDKSQPPRSGSISPDSSNALEKPFFVYSEDKGSDITESLGELLKKQSPIVDEGSLEKKFPFYELYEAGEQNGRGGKTQDLSDDGIDAVIQGGTIHYAEKTDKPYMDSELEFISDKLYKIKSAGKDVKISRSLSFKGLSNVLSEMMGVDPEKFFAYVRSLDDDGKVLYLWGNGFPIYEDTSKYFGQGPYETLYQTPNKLYYTKGIYKGKESFRPPAYKYSISKNKKTKFEWLSPKLKKGKVAYASCAVTDINYINRYGLIDSLSGSSRISTPGVGNPSLAATIKDAEAYDKLVRDLARRVVRDSIKISRSRQGYRQRGRRERRRQSGPRGKASINHQVSFSEYDLKKMILDIANVPRLNPISWSRPLFVDLVGFTKIRQMFNDGAEDKPRVRVKVLDIDTRFGSCLLSSMSLDMDYVGYQPDPDIYRGVQNVADFVRDSEYLYDGTATIINKDLSKEGTSIEGNDFDIVYVSPLPLSIETHPHSNADFSTYEEWLIGSLFKSIAKSWVKLKIGGHLVFIGEDIKYRGRTYLMSEPTNIYIETLPSSRLVGSVGLAMPDNKFKHVQAWIWRKVEGKKYFWSDNNKFLRPRSLNSMYPRLHDTLITSYINYELKSHIESTNKMIEEALTDYDTAVQDFAKNVLFRNKLLILAMKSMDKANIGQTIRLMTSSAYANRGIVV